MRQETEDRERHLRSREKWCPGCKVWLPLERFGNYSRSPSGKRARCKACFKEQNAPHIRKYLYGLPDSGLLAIWEGQGRCCAVCRENLPSQDRHACHVDRDPATGIVRGLLCPKCSRGLGGLQGSQVLLMEAVKYLRRFELRRHERRKDGI